MIRCAAVKFIMYDTHREVILCGRRHADCYEQLAMLGIYHDKYSVINEGFIINSGAFLDRYEAWDHAIECGQLPLTVQITSDCKGELYSEDLW